MSTDLVEINIKKLIEAGISINAYFILYCTYKGSKDLLEEYVRKCGTIDTSVFNKLISLGYLEPIASEILFDKLKLTTKAMQKFGWTPLDHKRYFAELKVRYPKRVKVGKSSRSLHQNMAECEKKYKAIVDSEEAHNNILKCVDLYLKELKDSNRTEWIQMLSTWINQRNYEQYLDEAINQESIVQANEDTYDVV